VACRKLARLMAGFLPSSGHLMGTLRIDVLCGAAIIVAESTAPESEGGDREHHEEACIRNGPLRSHTRFDCVYGRILYGGPHRFATRRHRRVRRVARGGIRRLFPACQEPPALRPRETIGASGLTSEPVAREMALGALDCSLAQVAISHTGLAGPALEGNDMPAGTQCFAGAFAGPGKARVFSETRVFSGERNEIRLSAERHAIERLPFYHEQAMRP
jgi:hypothetical protein